MFGNHGLCGLPEEGAHEKSPKCLDGNLGDFGEFCKGLLPSFPRRRESTFEFWKLFFKYLLLKISDGFPPAQE